MEPYRKPGDGPKPTATSEARSELAREAERLRRGRLDKQRDEQRAKKEAAEEARREARSFSRIRLATATAGRFVGWAATLCFSAGVVLGGGTILSNDLPWTTRSVAIAISFGPGTLLVLWWWMAPLFFRRWLARLPFAVEGIERALGGGEFVEEARVVVQFRGEAPERADLLELVRGGSGGTVVDSSAGTFAIHSASLGLESSNWPLRRWFRRLVRSTLLDVHRAYPIERVKVGVERATEYYVGVGD